MAAAIRHRSLWLCGLALAAAILAFPLAGAGQGTPEADPLPEATESLTATPTPPSETPTPTPTPQLHIPEPPTLTPAADIPALTSPTPTLAPLSPTPKVFVEPAGSPVEDSLPGEVPTETPTATATATPTSTMTLTPSPQPLSIWVESDGLRFGTIDASGEISGASSPGVVSEVDETGALFILPQAVTLVIEGDPPWSVACSAEGADPASDHLIASGRLQWRSAGSEVWVPFTPDSSICLLANAEGGSRIHVLDVRLQVNSGDPPGAFAATVAFRFEGQ